MKLSAHNGNGNGEVATLIDELLVEQRTLTAVERFSRHHDRVGHSTREKLYQSLMPVRSPGSGEQYAFEVDMDACSGCKACVAGCHSLNGLDENETWREVGLLIGDLQVTNDASRNADSALRAPPSAFQQTVTSACHHCVDPGCLNGCPVKAYDKDPQTGIVRHLDDQCIGCQYCVMKCPYEVPKYSEKLGIVRKCDMCVNRLAVGEAPACVQSCPNGAIKITIVKQAEIKTQYRNGETKNSFLAGSPVPKITLPTTRFITRRELQNLFAADHAAPRLDHPHWPLVIMLVLTQAAAGMCLAAAFAQAGGSSATKFLLLVAFTILNFGLMAAPLHLGRPLKAWRAFLGWRTSWLSREIIAFNQFAPLAAAATVLAWLPFLAQMFPKLGELLHKLPAWIPPLEKLQLPLILGAAAVGFGCVFVSAMVYVDTRRACWSPRHSFGAFTGTALLLGPALASVVAAVGGDAILAQRLAAFALLMRVALFIWRRLEIRFAVKNPASPIHLNARAIRDLLPQTLSLRLSLFIASVIFSGLAIINAASAIPLWTGAAAVTMLASEIVARYVFFRAGAGKKMPGGIAS